MTQVVWSTAMSVDGFIAGPGHSMGWVFEHSTPGDPEAERVKVTSGAILAGRNTHEVGRRADAAPEAQEPFGGGWEGRIYVLSHRPPPPDEDPAVTYLEGDIVAAVATAKAGAGDRDLLVFGADVARQVVEAGLMDELMLHVVPVLLGDGVRLFGDPPGAMVELETVEVSGFGVNADLRYRFRR